MTQVASRTKSRERNGWTVESWDDCRKLAGTV